MGDKVVEGVGGVGLRRVEGVEHEVGGSRRALVEVQARRLVIRWAQHDVRSGAVGLGEEDLGQVTGELSRTIELSIVAGAW